MLDKVFTMGSRNMDLGGFTERTILNAQMPMTERKVMVDGKEESVMVRAKLYFGSGVTNNFNGLPMERLNPDTGKTEIAGLTTPSIIYRDPTSFETFGGAIRAAKEAIYDEAKQLHVLMTGDASASGVSRQQAVTDFLTSLESTKHNLEQMFRWLLGTVLKMALHFMGRGSELEGWRISVQARFSTCSRRRATWKRQSSCRNWGPSLRKSSPPASALRTGPPRSNAAAPRASRPPSV